MAYTKLVISSTSTTTFTALSDAGMITAEYTSGTPESVVGSAALASLGAWVFSTGTKPKSTADSGLFQANGSNTVIQRIPADGTNPALIRCILFEGSSGAVASIRKTSITQSVAVGQYCDIVLGATPYITSPATFVEGETSGSERLMEFVNAARQTEGV